MVKELISLSTYLTSPTCLRRARSLSHLPAKMERMSVEAPTSRDELIGDLDDEQREAVLAARGPVCVLAGAGTGRTASGTGGDVHPARRGRDARPAARIRQRCRHWFRAGGDVSCRGPPPAVVLLAARRRRHRMAAARHEVRGRRPGR